MIDPSLPFLPINEEINIVDCCNGLLLCQYTSPQHDYEYIVCNPTTEKWTKLPKTEAMDYVNTITLGFDPAVSSHFRVFLLAQDIILDQDPNMYHGAGVEIYSSETGRWTYRQSEWGDLPKLLPCIRKKSVFLNGVMHFPVIGSLLLAVDMEGKTWRKIPTPNQTLSSFLGLCQGRLYSVHIDHNNDDTQLSVWVLEDYSGEQWTLKHYVTLEPSERRHLEFEGGNGVIAIHPERELVFLTLGRQCNLLISFDVESRTAHDICSLGVIYDIPCLPYVPSFSEWLSDGNE
jgi:F-box interacting protein